MSMTVVGKIKAHLPKAGGQDTKYITIGTLFLDDAGRHVIKLDSIPVEKNRWTGWCNVFSEDWEPRPKKEPAPESGRASLDDDDIPF